MGIVSKTLPILAVGVVIVIALVVIMQIMKAKHARAAAAAAETERILNTPLEQLGSETDDLVNKYK